MIVVSMIGEISISFEWQKTKGRESDGLIYSSNDSVFPFGIIVVRGEVEDGRQFDHEFGCHNQKRNDESGIRCQKLKKGQTTFFIKTSLARNDEFGALNRKHTAVSKEYEDCTWLATIYTKKN